MERHIFLRGSTDNVLTSGNINDHFNHRRDMEFDKRHVLFGCKEWHLTSLKPQYPQPYKR